MGSQHPYFLLKSRGRHNWPIKGRLPATCPRSAGSSFGQSLLGSVGGDKSGHQGVAGPLAEATEGLPCGSRTLSPPRDPVWISRPAGSTGGWAQSPSGSRGPFTVPLSPGGPGKAGLRGRWWAGMWVCEAEARASEQQPGAPRGSASASRRGRDPRQRQ